MICFKEVKYKYAPKIVALDGITFNVDSGETIAVVGANGAGKSTLLQLMTGIYLPSEGTVSVDGTMISEKTLPEIRAKVGMVFQNPDDQLFMTKLWQDIAFGPQNMGMSPEEVEKQVNDALRALGIEELRDRYSHKLSGGEKRRGAIATVIAMNPQYILLDEPTSFLDPRARKNVIDLLRKLPYTKIIATHDLDMALAVCSRTIVLSEGKISADGDTREILLDEALMESCGLELPLSAGRYNE